MPWTYMRARMDSNKQIEDKAAEWLVRRELGEFNAAEQARLEEWLNVSFLNRVAYLRLDAAWEQTERLRALAPGAAPRTVPARGSWRVSPFFARKRVVKLPPRWRYRLFLPWVAAVLPIVFVAAGWYFWTAAAPTYETPIGGTASIPLRDGSNVTLNTASKIRVALTDRERRIELRNGEAFFDVAKDSTRPFIVDTGDRHIVAVGTKFSVRRDGHAVAVIVTEGKVRIDSTSPETLTPAPIPVLEAGTIARASGTAIAVETKTSRWKPKPFTTLKMR
jgi:transmembrane sensor